MKGHYPSERVLIRKGSTLLCTYCSPKIRHKARYESLWHLRDLSVRVVLMNPAKTAVLAKKSTVLLSSLPHAYKRILLIQLTS